MTVTPIGAAGTQDPVAARTSGRPLSLATAIGVLGRVPLAGLFILAGIAKVTGPAPFLAHMAAHGVPGGLLPAVYALEIGAGGAFLIGWRTPIFAGLLSGFCVLTAFLFHLDLADHVERTMFLKDLALAGAFTVIAANAAQSARVASAGQAVSA